MRKIFLLSLFSLIFSLQVWPQKPVSIDVVKAKIKTLKFGDRYYGTGYVKSANQSLIYCRVPVRSQGTFASNETVIDLNVGFAFQGTSFDKSLDRFAFFFRSLGRRWVFLKNEPIVVNADGQIFDLGKSAEDSDFKETFLLGDLTQDSLVYFGSRSELEKIANSTKVEIKVGDLIYKIKAKELEPVKNLLSLAAVE